MCVESRKEGDCSNCKLTLVEEKGHIRDLHGGFGSNAEIDEGPEGVFAFFGELHLPTALIYIDLIGIKASPIFPRVKIMT